MTHDLTPKILADIREEMRGMRDDIRDLRSGMGAMAEQLAVVVEHLAAVAHIVKSIDTRLGHVEKRQKEATFLPRRVDKLEITTKRHAQRLSRLEKKPKTKKKRVKDKL